MVQPAALPSGGSQLQRRGTCHDQGFGCGHARCDSVVSVDPRPPKIQCATNPEIWLDEFSNLNVVRKCQTFLATLSLGKVGFRSTSSWSTSRRKFRLKYQTVAKFLSSVAEDLEKDLLKVHPTANYKDTKEDILEQSTLKRECLPRSSL